MPRSLDEILAHADDLAARFENYEPSETHEFDASALALLQAAVQSRAEAERTMIQAIGTARDAGLSWAAIGRIIGTSGEAARQKYSGLVA